MTTLTIGAWPKTSLREHHKKTKSIVQSVNNKQIPRSHFKQKVILYFSAHTGYMLSGQGK